MQWLSRLFGRSTVPETRSIRIFDPLTDRFTTVPGVGHVDADRASAHAVANRCIALIAEALASVPCRVYRRTPDGGQEPANDLPLYDLLQDQMGDLTAFEGREWLAAAALVHGNSYAGIERDGAGRVVRLVPFIPGSTAVDRMASGRLRYAHSKPDGGTDILLQDEVLHIRYRIGPSGCTGISPIQHARETLFLALTQRDEAITQATTNFRSPGILSFPNNMTNSAQLDEVRKSFLKAFVGSATRNEPIILDGGAEFHPFSISSRDAEFLESRKLSNLDVCRIYGVPPSAVGITDDSTYSNIGEESRALVVRCLAPWARRIEQAMERTLLTPAARREYFIEHELSGLLRGDVENRYAAYKVGREAGFLSVNEIRKLESLSKIEGGDSYLTPLNMSTGADDANG